MPLTVLIGGARSGKSALAVELGRRHGDAVTYIATAPESDEDMVTRIARHRAERPPGWRTVETERDLEPAIRDAPDGHLVIVDCLTLWTSNMMWHGASDDAIADAAEAAATRAAARRERVVAVSNEVGSGVHPDTALGRRYRDALGRVNQVWAAHARDTLLLVAGKALRLDDPMQLVSGETG